MVNINWEKEGEYIKPTRGKKSIPTLSFLTSGYCRTNRLFNEKHGLEDKKAVKIKVVKRDSKAIVGMMFLDTEEDGSFKIIKDDRTHSFSFSLRSLFDHLGMDYKKFEVKKFDPEIQNLNKNEIFVIEIPIK